MRLTKREEAALARVALAGLLHGIDGVEIITFEERAFSLSAVPDDIILSTDTNDMERMAFLRAFTDNSAAMSRICNGDLWNPPKSLEWNYTGAEIH